MPPSGKRPKIGYGVGVPQYVALLRGINVGGHNVIKMMDLRRCFESRGFDSVATYIQSGNVVFDVPEPGPGTLLPRVEAALLDEFGYQQRIVVRSHGELHAIVADAPAGFGSQPDLYRYDAVFLSVPLTSAVAMQDMTAREGVDRVSAGDGVCYFSRLISRATQSHLTRIIALPVYQSMTIRNWNTTVKLLALMDARANA